MVVIDLFEYLKTKAKTFTPKPWFSIDLGDGDSLKVKQDADGNLLVNLKVGWDESIAVMVDRRNAIKLRDWFDKAYPTRKQ
jgi:hypothetical protein